MPPLPIDEVIGRNVAAARAGRSQQSIAELMRSRGWKWSQATVWSIEKGERPLRLAEAQDLAIFLGTSVTTLLDDGGAHFYEYRILASAEAVLDAFDEAAASMAILMQEQARFEESSIEKWGAPLADHVWLTVRRAEAATPERVLSRAEEIVTADTEGRSDRVRPAFEAKAYSIEGGDMVTYLVRGPGDPELPEGDTLTGEDFDG